MNTPCPFITDLGSLLSNNDSPIFLFFLKKNEQSEEKEEIFPQSEKLSEGQSGTL